MGTGYKVINGTSYNQDTPQKLIDVLENCRLNKTRIVIDYGDTATGISWNEVNDVVGYVGRTTGNDKIPLLVYNSRSFGGTWITQSKILHIRESKGKKLIYSFNEI